MIEPNFFIVGAPKAGTTALSHYLASHDQVFISDPKELFYFCADFTNLPGPATESEYLAHFSQASTRPAAFGEATAMYLYSDVALGRIRERFPSARIVVMLRNPREIARSFHAQQLFGRSEDVESFEDAWRLQSERAAGKALPRLVREPRFLQYGEVARIGHQVERLLSIFPRDQVLFLFFDDFSADPGSSYRQVLGFLDVEDDGRTSFPVVNERKANRLGWLADILNRPPPWASRIVAKAKHTLGYRTTEISILDFARRLNSRRPDEDRPTDGFVAELNAFFREDVQKLSSLVDRDLTFWVN